MTILEAIKSGRKVQTRDGQKIRILCSDRKGANPIIALVGDDERLVSYDKDGFPLTFPNEPLKIIPKKKTLWFNVYIDDEEIQFGRMTPYKSKEEAWEAAAQSKLKSDYICTKSIDIEI